MANRTRSIVLRVPVTAEERALIEKKMQQMGTSCFSTYARKMLIDGYVIKIDYSDIKAMTAELQKLGTNINQIIQKKQELLYQIPKPLTALGRFP